MRRPALAVLVVVFSALRPGPAVEKLKPEELVAKHLESLGTPEARARYRTCVANGTVTMGGVVGAGSGELTGKLSILSDREKVRLGMEFPSKSFPGDHYAFDGKEVTVSYLQPGVRSVVGAFLYQNAYLVSEGIISGALSTNWALLRTAERNPRLSYSGLKKVGDRRYHALRYRPRKGGHDIEVTFFFDPETFRHIRTELKFEPPNQVPSDSAASARQVDTRLVISEEFESFQVVEGLNLPTIYRIEANLTGARTLVYRWLLTLNEFFLNRELDPAYFRVN